MRARVLHKFFDVKAKVDRRQGEEFEATAARVREINAAGYGQLVEAVEDKKPAETPEEKGE